MEFSLDEISTELAKLGVRETSPSRLAAIKNDLDQLIARDLEIHPRTPNDFRDSWERYSPASSISVSCVHIT